MHINKLLLTDYRNYDTLDLTFENRVNVILGENAQGKTNVMEAIYVLAMARSHRTSKDKELIRWDQPFARVEGALTNRYGAMKMEMMFTSRGKKVKLNGLEKKRLSDYIGACTIVMFAPEDLSLVKGSPQVRRRFLDMEMGQIYTVYLYYLSQYYKILKQRNRWLKQVQQKQADFDEGMWHVFTKQLVDAGAEVILKRYGFIRKLEDWARPIHYEISRGKETLNLLYDSTVKSEEGDGLDAIRSVFFEQLEEVMDQETRRGTTVIGPHRDDLIFHVNDRNVQTYGSQGQQRTTALSLKLAEIELIHEKTGEYPILLLDDVLSELDDHRQTHLLNSIKGKVQTFVTTTSVEGIHHDMLKQASMFEVTDGSIQQLE